MDDFWYNGPALLDCTCDHDAFAHPWGSPGTGGCTEDGCDCPGYLED